MTYLTVAVLVLLLVAMLLVLSAAVLVMTPFALPMFLRGAPFVPSGRKTAERMLELGGVRPGEWLVDLGSGDGRIVIAAARRGMFARGVELNPWLVWWSRWRARLAGVQDRAAFSCGNLWSFNCQPFDAVTVYGLGPIMLRLERKLLAELTPGARVVSHAFKFPNWKPSKVEERVYVYDMPNK